MVFCHDKPTAGSLALILASRFGQHMGDPFLAPRKNRQNKLLKKPSIFTVRMNKKCKKGPKSVKRPSERVFGTRFWPFFGLFFGVLFETTFFQV